MENVVMDNVITSSYCSASRGCQSEYGDCRCSIGFGDCPSGQCCGIGGYCGTTSAYCSLALGCQIIYGECSTGRCGTKYGNCPTD